MKKIYIFFVIFVLFVFKQSVLSDGYSTVSGQVTNQESRKGILVQNSGSIFLKVLDEKTGAGIPGVKVIFDIMTEFHTDKNGVITIKDIEPEHFYSITFYPPNPYCVRSKIRVFIDKGDNIVNHTIGKGGSLMGKIYKLEGIPLRNAKVTIGGNGLRESYDTKEDGSYFVERLCPFKNYSISVSHKIPGLSFRFLKGIKIKSGECTTVKDILFNTANGTEVEGFVTSALDGKPLPGVEIILCRYIDNCTHCGQMGFGSVRIDSKGHFSLKNIDPPGLYFVMIFLPLPIPNNPDTGEKVYTSNDFKKNKKEIDIIVKKVN